MPTRKLSRRLVDVRCRKCDFMPSDFPTILLSLKGRVAPLWYPHCVLWSELPIDTSSLEGAEPKQRCQFFFQNTSRESTFHPVWHGQGLAKAVENSENTKDTESQNADCILLKVPFESVEDARRCVNYLKDKADDLGLDRETIVLAGRCCHCCPCCQCWQCCGRFVHHFLGSSNTPWVFRKTCRSQVRFKFSCDVSTKHRPPWHPEGHQAVATLLQWQPWAPKNLALALLGSFAALELALGLFSLFLFRTLTLWLVTTSLTCLKSPFSYPDTSPFLLPASESVSVTPCFVRRFPVRDTCGIWAPTSFHTKKNHAKPRSLQQLLRLLLFNPVLDLQFRERWQERRWCALLVEALWDMQPNLFHSNQWKTGQ